MILQGILAIPGTWLGLSPILTFNLVLLAGFALSGWAFALLVHRDTGSWIAGLAAGSAVAFNAHHLVRLAHIQALHLELVPLVFFAVDRLLITGRRRYAVLMGAALALQATASIYLLVFSGWALLCAWLARVPEWRGRLRETTWWSVLAATTCALLLLPVLWPYAELARNQGMVRTLGETQRCAATWTDYLYTGSRVHFDAWSYRFNNSSDANFPGLIVAALARSPCSARAVEPHAPGCGWESSLVRCCSPCCRGCRASPGCTTTFRRWARSGATHAPGRWRSSASPPSPATAPPGCWDCCTRGARLRSQASP